MYFLKIYAHSELEVIFSISSSWSLCRSVKSVMLTSSSGFLVLELKYDSTKWLSWWCSLAVTFLDSALGFLLKSLEYIFWWVSKLLHILFACSKSTLHSLVSGLQHWWKTQKCSQCLTSLFQSWNWLFIGHQTKQLMFNTVVGACSMVGILLISVLTY